MRQKTYKQKLDAVEELVKRMMSDKLTTEEEFARIILSVLGIDEKKVSDIK